MNAKPRRARYDQGPLTTPEKKQLFQGNPEFKKMNEDPPESVIKVRDQMGKAAAKGKDPIWIVLDPGPESTFEDIFYKTTVDELPHLVIGTTAATWKQENTAIHLKESEANKDAEARWKKMKGTKKMATQLLMATDQFEDALKEGKFEKDKPADPTENMSPEDAAEWKKQNEAHKDEFKAASRSPLLAMDFFAEALKEGKFEQGVSVPLSELPEELQENVEDPPESVQNLKKKMEEGKAADGSEDVPFDLFFNKSAADFNPWVKELGGGTAVAFRDLPIGASFSFPKSDDVQVKVKGGYKSPEGRKFTTGSGTSVIPVKTAATTASGKWGFPKSTESACTAGVNKLSKAAMKIAKALYAKDEGSPAFLSKHSMKGGSRTATMLLKAMEGIGPLATIPKVGKTAGKTGNGLYGFPSKTAKLGLEACTALHHEAGEIACDLFARKGADPMRLAAYLKKEAGKGKCAYSAMLGECAPDLDLDVSATVKKASDFMATAIEACGGGDSEDLDVVGILAGLEADESTRPSFLDEPDLPKH